MNKPALMTALITLTFSSALFGAASLSFSSRPSGAEVLINGRAVGQTPCSSAIPPGEYKIRLVMAGYQPEEFIAAVSGNDVDYKEIVLKNLEGRIAITSAPPATVILDGKEKGMTPFEGSINTGRHTLRLARACYNDKKISFTITESRPFYESFRLSKKMTRRQRCGVIFATAGVAALGGASAYYLSSSEAWRDYERLYNEYLRADYGETAAAWEACHRKYDLHARRIRVAQALLASGSASFAGGVFLWRHGGYHETSAALFSPVIGMAGRGTCGADINIYF